MHFIEFESTSKMAANMAAFPYLDFSRLLICCWGYYSKSKKPYFISFTISLMFNFFSPKMTGLITL